MTCLNFIQRAWERAERNEATRDNFRSVPQVGVKKRVRVSAESWASPAESIRTVYFTHTCHVKLLSTSIFGGIHLHLKIIPGYVFLSFPFGWVVCVVFPKKTNPWGATLLLPFPTIIATSSLVPFRSFPCSLVGVETRPDDMDVRRHIKQGKIYNMRCQGCTADCFTLKPSSVVSVKAMSRKKLLSVKG